MGRMSRERNLLGLGTRGRPNGLTAENGIINYEVLETLSDNIESLVSRIVLPWDFAQRKTFNFPKFIRSVILSGINSRSNRENGTYLSARGIWYDISSGRLSQGCRKLLTQTTEGQCHNNFSVFMSENTEIIFPRAHKFHFRSVFHGMT